VLPKTNKQTKYTKNKTKVKIAGYWWLMLRSGGSWLEASLGK
jgi:hypothetical protein